MPSARKSLAAAIVEALSLYLNEDGLAPPRPGWLSPTLHGTLLAVDIRAFGDRRRDDSGQLHLRKVMYTKLADAFAQTGLSWSNSYREDRGDGVMILLPPGTPMELLLRPLTIHLREDLRRYNRYANDVSQLHLRIAAHQGLVRYDGNGLAGRTTIELFRMLEAAQFKKEIDRCHAELGVIVSDRLYQGSMSGSGPAEQMMFRPLRINCKETRSHTWISLHWP